MVISFGSLVPIHTKNKGCLLIFFKVTGELGAQWSQVPSWVTWRKIVVPRRYWEVNSQVVRPHASKLRAALVQYLCGAANFTPIQPSCWEYMPDYTES